ncbi:MULTISPECIES: VOC family protein [unclassified Pseudomonas]|uniref:VOC family protein n=1 Tax=unclassified Pseudomonas TaxID=196821 RepID=UPI001E5B7ADA|nr:MULTISPECIES: VOC family protein [unclassified Pseudomonas]MDC0689426.1 VOC family protein [Mitsuaria sp. RG]MCE0917098.1 VOC family protein [Pseudomonas sp. NMI760_13]MCP8635416.1 VOC family protein [Pseudomonas sp. DVZ6]MDD7785780.1 VOC family protein [Pseudomonas sp. DVZ24]BDU09880.1 glyoxalase [Pseudomonas sp. RtIB026]
MAVKPIPEGQRSITPYLGIKDAAKAIEFYKKAFGAVEMFRLEDPQGRVGHAELKIGDSSLMLGSPCDMEGGLKPSEDIEVPGVGLHLYVEDCDKVYANAIAAGAKPIKEVQDQFYGDRSGTLMDPFNNLWFVSTHKEDLTPEEIRARAAKLFSSQ